MIDQRQLTLRPVVPRLVPIVVVALLGIGAAACSSSGASGNAPKTTHAKGSSGGYGY